MSILPANGLKMRGVSLREERIATCAQDVAKYGDPLGVSARFTQSDGS
jgi:hypothetical protein